jgi:hypothetical protein
MAGADLDGAVAAGGADELPDGPAGAVPGEPGDGQAAKTMARWASMESRLRWQLGRARRPDLDIRNDFPVFQSSW